MGRGRSGRRGGGRRVWTDEDLDRLAHENAYGDGTGPMMRRIAAETGLAAISVATSFQNVGLPPDTG